MLRLIPARVLRTTRQAAVFSALAILATVSGLRQPEARAIEMFTYFGDGSRIGLPSLEVPIEAYPGIPLRSDRIRARNRAMMMRRGGQVPPGALPPGQLQPSRGITIRTMPRLESAPVDAPVAPEPPAQ
jgi:hypothetical protein